MLWSVGDEEKVTWTGADWEITWGTLSFSPFELCCTPTACQGANDNIIYEISTNL